jgi:hypothetical protein
MELTMTHDFIFTKEYWTGDSRDGVIVNGDGFHYFRMDPNGLILEAYEVYEGEDGEETVTPLPEMKNVSWIKDFGFEDLDALDAVEELEFAEIKNRLAHELQS